MSNDAIQFACNVERVAFSGRALPKLMADKGARYCLKLGANRIAISKTSGCLLGESLAEHLGISGSAVVTYQHDDQYTIVSYGKDGVIAEYMNVSLGDYILLLTGECADKDTLWLCGDDDLLLSVSSVLPQELEIKRIDTGDIDSYFAKMASGGAIKFTLQRPKREKGILSPPFVLGGLALLIGAVFLMRNSSEDEKPVDPYASYKMEMSGATLSSALNMAVHAVQSSLDVATWKIENVSVDTNQTTIFFSPVIGEGVIKEISEWSKRKGYSYIMSPEGVLVSIPNTQLTMLDSNRIQSNIKGSVELIYDSLNKLSMFKTVISPIVNKGNFNVVPIVFSGEGMILEEVNDLAKLMGKFPIRVESVRLKPTTVEFVFDVSIAATAIGE